MEVPSYPLDIQNSINLQLVHLAILEGKMNKYLKNTPEKGA